MRNIFARGSIRACLRGCEGRPAFSRTKSRFATCRRGRRTAFMTDSACGTSKRWKRPYSRRSEEHTSELQSLMRISYAVFCLKKKHEHSNHQVRDTYRSHSILQLYSHITPHN